MKLEEILPEARKGRKIKLKSWPEFKSLEGAIAITIDNEFLCDDWQLAPKSVTVTKEQFARVFDNAVGLGMPMLHMYNYICKELGLGDDK